MSELNICRICLRTDGKMHNYVQFQLKSYYEQVMALEVNELDGLPQCFCYECAAILHKFHKFKEKCYSGQKVLKEIQWKGPITYESVIEIDKQSKNLKSNVDIVIVSNRVRVVKIKHKSLSTTSEIYETGIPQIENVEVDSQNHCYSESDGGNNDSDYEPIEDETIDDKNITIVENELPDVTKTVVEEEKLFSDVDLTPINFVKNDANVKIDTLLKKLSDDEQVVIDFSKKVETKTTMDAVVKITTDEEKMSSDDEKALINFKKIIDNQKIDKVIEKSRKKFVKRKDTKKRKKSKEKPEPTTNKFRLVTKKGNVLDNNNWVKIYLTEEEAEREFKARGEDRKYLKAPFKCTDCFKGFSQQDMLDRHIKLRHIESLGPIECRFCRMRFKWKCYLTRHMPRHYNIYKCLRCNLVCRMETSALFHEDYHNGVIRKCKHCGEEFRHLSTYYTHLRTHRSEHVCNLCGVSFVSEAGLHLHKLVKHIGAKPAKEGIKVETEADTYCERCNIKFETKAAYEEHLFHSAMHSKGVEDLAEDIPAPARPKVRRKGMRTPRKPTACSYCGKVFPTQSACMKHHHSEHPRTPFCPNEERTICEICGIPLAVGSVANHLNTHTRARVFTCNTCGVEFNSKSSMQRHQLTHTGEKPYPCTLCDKRFTQSNSVKLHYRTFHLKQPYPKRNRRKKTDEDTVMFV